MAKGIRVDMRYKDGGKIIVNDDDASIQVLTNGAQVGPMEITMNVTIDRTQFHRGDWHVFEQKGEVHASPLKNLEEDDPMIKRFVHTFPIHKGAQGSYVMYKEACVKLLELYKNGHFRIWEVGVTRRGKRFFFVCQLVYDEWAYRDGNMVVIPALDRWQSLRKILFLSEYERTTPEEEQRRASVDRLEKEYIWPYAKGAVLPPNLLEPKNLEPVAKYAPDVITACGLPEGQGRVQFWNECSGMGSLITSQGTAKVHFSKLRDANKLADFEKAQIVGYSKLVPPADNRSQFKWEAVGVFPVQ